MALKKREKKMLKGLLVVAILAALKLIPWGGEDVSTQKPADETTQEEVAVSGSRGGSSRGGGSRGGGGSSSKKDTIATISMASFQKHSHLKDCWVVIKGEVYNITSFLEANDSHRKTGSQFCGTIGFDAGFIQNDNHLSSAVIRASQKVGKIG